MRGIQRRGKVQGGYAPSERRTPRAKPYLETLEERLVLATDSWSGAGTTAFWSNSVNWGGQAPSAGDNLVFPTGVTRLGSTNDITPGSSFGTLTLLGTSYNLSGNPIVLTGGLSASNSSGSNLFSLDTTLGSSLSFTAVNTGTVLNIGQPIHLAGNTFTVAGLGAINITGLIGGAGGLIADTAGKLTLSANNVYSGPTTVEAGSLLINGSQPNNAISVDAGAALGGTGTVGAVTVTGGALDPGSPTGPGTLTVDGNVTLDSSSSVNVELNGATPGQGYDQLVVNGSIDLAGSTLNATLNYASIVGTAFTIIHSTGGLNGTFNGLSNGSTFSFSGKSFEISYTATDVVLKQVTAATLTAMTSSVNNGVFGQAVTFTATVTPVAPNTGVPTGTVNFSVDGTSSFVATLANGKATFTTFSLPVGNHLVTANYKGDVNYSSSSSADFPQNVSPSNSSTVLSSSANPSLLGNAVTITATINAVAPGIGTPTGSVVFAIDGISQPAVNLVSGQATMTTSALSGGAHALTASYSGDGNFNASVSTTFTQTVNAVNTATTFTVSPNPSVVGQPLVLTATVSPTGSTNFSPTGVIVFDNGGSILGTVPLTGNTASMTLSTLSRGSYSLTAKYKGDDNFSGSTSTGITQVVNPSSTTIQIQSSAGTVLFGTRVTFSIQVSATPPGSGAPSGTVVFLDGATTIGSVALSNSTGAFSTSSFVIGKNAITAVFTGSTNFSSSTSAPLVEEVGTTDQRFVVQLYLDLLNRPVDINGFNTWMTVLSQGGTHAQVAQAIEGSQEYQTDVIENLYHQYLHRDADPAGLAYFLGRFEAGDTQEEMAAAIAGSQEYFSTRGGATNDGFLTALYLDTLNRVVDPGGRSFFDAELAAGLSRAQAAAQILSSVEYRQDLIEADYQHYLHRQADPTGLNILLSDLQQGVRDEDVISAIAGSDEYASLA